MKNAIAPISQKLQAPILEAISKLPPESALDMVETEDQLIYWMELRKSYKWLEQAFVDYFSGEGANLKGLSPKLRNFYGCFRDFYLEFYSLIQWNWEGLNTFADSRGFDLSALARSPGDLLILVIRQHAEMAIDLSHQPLHRFSPHEARKLAKEQSDLSKSGVLVKAEKGELLSPKEKGLIKKYHANLKKARRDLSPFNETFQMCLDVCVLQAMENKRDRTLHRHLKSFFEARSNLDGAMQSLMHPRNKAIGWEWQKGQRRTLSRYGGVAEK